MRLPPLALAFAALLASGLAGDARAAPPPAGLVLEVKDPAPLSYDATALGKATHRVRLALTNTTGATLATPPLRLRFEARKDDLTYACEEPTREDERWPSSLGPGESVVLEHAVACETPLPGRYAVTVLGRTRGPSTGDDERALGSFALVVEPGNAPPVRVPWDRRMWVAATASRDARPGAGASSGVRVVLGAVNGSTKEIAMPAMRFVLTVTRVEKGGAPCGERFADVPAAKLGAGHAASVALTLACDFRSEGTYETRVQLVGEGGGRLLVAKLPTRISALPTPLPPPAGGMMGGR